ncbi:hypothetical protein EDC01DRAFT_623557 [Geopyxis carbonaria]|nr:hypothetical protein EDC01DRAFT_623557 [Geopyxis carbonaria]
MPCYPTQPHLPPTPPEYIQQYSSCGMQVNQHQYPMGSQGLPEKGVYEINIDPYGRKLMPSFVRVSAQGYHAGQQPNYSGLPPPGITHPSSQYYPQTGHATQRRTEAPLPTEDAYGYPSRQDVRRQDAVQPEEKPTGGVSAHLDYDMDEITEFVGHMAQRLVIGKPPERLLPSYRKFVFQILSSTRLPSSTILLGLVYLRERVQMPHMIGLRMEHVYRLLTICLLLASKFLDDNTFQNKSWSEVTNIPVGELNELEKDWLKDIKWNLHVDPEGTKGFSQYRTMWEAWMKKNTSSTVSPPLAPIDTNARPRSHSTFSPVPMYPSHQHYNSSHPTVTPEWSVQLPPVRSSQHESPQWWSTGDYSPPSAPETGPATPEGYFGWSAPAFGTSTQPPPQTNYSRLPPIVPSYGHHSWNNHIHGVCSCGYCRQGSEGYFVPTYGQPITA